jgi:predicted DNA binding CopG/RHH family protein
MRIVELIIDEDAELYGIDAISLVDRPAIELDFIALKEARVQFAEADADKRILIGPALVPDKPIYRRSGEEEFYVYFSKSTVRRAAELYLKHGNQANHTLEHEHTINGLTVVESWMVEANVWRIQTSKNLYQQRDPMNIAERVQEVFKRFNVNLTVSEEVRTDLAEAVLDNGTVIYTDGDDFAEGAEAYIINDEGERIPLPPGDYTLQDGGVIVIAEGGKVASVNKGGKDGAPGKGKDAPAAEAPAAEKAPAPTKDPAPSKDPVPTKDPTPTRDPRTRAEEDEEEVMYVTKSEVEAMIAAALESLAPKEEKMSEEAAELSQEVADEGTEEVAEELSAQEDPVVVELASVKAELEAMKKQAAEGGLKHAAPTKKVEPVNLKNLSTSERVSALLNQFSK